MTLREHLGRLLGRIRAAPIDWQTARAMRRLPITPRARSRPRAKPATTSPVTADDNKAP
jgi:hypothetical protein